VAHWDFEDSLEASTGQAALVAEAAGPAAAPGVTFEDATLRGAPARVARFTRGTYFRAHPGFGANGGGSNVNRYTVVMDVLFPDRTPSNGWASLLQTSPTNTNDGDWFINPAGGLGISGKYNGAVPAGEWRRLAVVVDLAAGTLVHYIDGARVGENGGQSLDGRFSFLPPSAGASQGILFFADENAENAEGLVDAFQIRSAALCPEDVAALGAAADKPLDPAPAALEACAPPAAAIKEGPYLQWATSSEVTVMWETTARADSTVWYRRSVGDWTAVAGPAGVTIHEVRLGGFDAGETVEYYVASRIDALELKSEASTFTTNPPGAPDFKMVVWGDNQANPPVFTSLVQGMVGLSPDIAFACGDVVDDGDDYYRWGAELLTPLKPLAKSVPFYVAIGNHERNSHWFYDYIAQPGNEHWFSFDYAGCHFTIIDSNFPFGPGSEQYDWIVDDLFSPAAKSAKWLFTFHHHPPYSEVEEEATYDRLRKHLVPVYEAAGVDINFTGHIHDYERGIYTPPDTGRRIVYLQTSGGGGRLWDDVFDGEYEQITKVVQYVYHFCEVKIEGDTLTLRAISLQGQVIDSFSLTALPRSGEPPPPPPPPPPGGGTALTQWDFDDGTLEPSFGQGMLDYFDGEAGATSRQARFGTTSALGVPRIGGVDAAVLRVPKASGAAMGLKMAPDAPPNAGGAYVNAYSLVLDLLIPATAFLSDDWLSIINTSPTNANDGDVFVKLDTGGLGISSVYEGQLLRDTWHRVGLVFTPDAGSIRFEKYVDGQKVGTQNFANELDGRWSINAKDTASPWALLFADNDGESAVCYISSLLFVDRALTAADVADLGGPDGDGILAGPCIGECRGLFRRGDANVDGSLDIIDPIYTLLLLYVDARSPVCERALDANDDGRIQLADAIYTLDHLFRLGPAPLAPFPHCGEDMTADGLTCSGVGSCQ